MEASLDSEKQHLVETHLEPIRGMNPPEDKCCDSEFSDDASSVDGLWQPEPLCQEISTVSGAETEARRLARSKLLTACAVSVVFMTGELIARSGMLMCSAVCSWFTTLVFAITRTFRLRRAAAGGYAAHSLAIMTDAAHLLTDFAGIVISIFSLCISSKPQTHTMTFGWHRAEILGVLLSVASIWAVTAVLVLLAVQRITDGDYDIDSHIMLITSGCAVGVNVLMVLILNQSGASHTHGFTTNHSHSHGHTSASVKAAFIHVVGDLLQSVGVLLAATIIHFWPEYKIADPVCTFLFSVLVVGTTVPVTRDVFRTLMEGTPQNINFNTVRKLLLSVRGVVAVHSLHMWSLNMSHSLLSVHVVTEDGADAQTVLMKSTKLLRSEFSFSSITIQVERCSTVT